MKNLQAEADLPVQEHISHGTGKMACDTIAIQAALDVVGQEDPQAGAPLPAGRNGQ